MTQTLRRLGGLFWQGLESLIQSRNLIVQLAKRDIAAKYRGSLLGVLWMLVLPLTMLGVYSFVFGVVFKSKWTQGDTPIGDFALYLFAGLTMFNIFSESVSRAPGLLLENVSFIKKVVFPIEILPVVSLITALASATASFAMLLLIFVATRGLPPPSAVLLPVVLLPLCLMTLGASWFLSAVGVYLRDLRQAISPIMSMLIFLVPVFYPLAAVPARVSSIVAWNPLTPVLEQGRMVLFDGRLPNPWDWLCLMIFSAAVAILGLLWMQATRRGFADVI